MINKNSGQVSKAEAIQIDWFTKRGLRLLNYQTEVLIKVKQSMQSQEVTVLAACPSAGKTIMVINTIEDYLRQNPTHKVLVLAHGTTILRTQFHDNLVLLYSKIKSDFKYNLVEKYNQYDYNANVNVCLPQTLNGKTLNNIDLLVVDEAHQFYFAKMVRDIIKVVKPERQLLITGTPSPFIRRGYSILPVPLNTIFDENMVSDVYIEIATSSYNFGLGDYNQQDELKSRIQIRDSETKKTLDDLIGKIVERLKTIRGDETVLIAEWLPTLEKLHKTMFVCKTQLQAFQVQRYFDKIGVKSALSTSDFDIDSFEIDRFKREEDCLVLIVVGRGILGFNFPELVNVVDMTTSQNVDRIYQLLCRVIRKHPKGERKLFFKIAPSSLSEYYKYIMTGVLALNDESFFTVYNGRNFDSLKIPVRRNLDGSINAPNHFKRKDKFRPIKLEGLPAIEFFKSVSQQNNSILNPYAKATIRDIRTQFMERTPRKYWTKENCIESASNYYRVKEWKQNQSGAYDSALDNNWIQECTLHMKKVHRWTKDECIDSAVNYHRITDWRRNESRAFDAARAKNWLEECTNHMKKVNHLTKENCIESASKYSGISEWRRKELYAYDAAKRNGWLKECKVVLNTFLTKEKCIESALIYKRETNWSKRRPIEYNIASIKGWLDECTSHMGILKSSESYWTKEKCFESALEYDKRTEWRHKQPLAYKIARKNGWFDECTAHMEKIKKSEFYWTKEKCVESALEYNRRTNWMQKRPLAYKTARNNNWLEECTEHMEKLKNPQSYWTKEKCIESALKFNTKRDWSYSENPAYAAACKYNWLTDCTAHMKCLRKPNGFWTKEKCSESAIKYASSRQWAKCDKGAYETARRNGWLPECNAHLKRDSLTKRMEISISSSS